MRIQSDAGQADALNRGFKYSDGSILGWVNSDDVLLPGALETVVEVFEANPNIEVVYGGAFFLKELTNGDIRIFNERLPGQGDFSKILA